MLEIVSKSTTTSQTRTLDVPLRWPKVKVNIATKCLQLCLHECISTVMLSLRISASSGVPLYLQIEQQIKRSIASGILCSGDALPSTRRAAADLRINPNTVARAFQNLERDGIIRTVPGGGTYIASFVASGTGLLKVESIRRLRPLATQLAVEATQLRVPSEEIHKLLDSTLHDLEKSRRSHKASSSSNPKDKNQ